MLKIVIPQSAPPSGLCLKAGTYGFSQRQAFEANTLSYGNLVVPRASLRYFRNQGGYLFYSNPNLVYEHIPRDQHIPYVP